MASIPIDGTIRRANEATALRVLDMPFMEDVTTLDALTVNALEVLMFADEDGSLQKVLSLPDYRDGITDEQTNRLAVLTLADDRPGLLDAVLDPEQTSVQKRVITLPHTGEVTLSVVEPEGFAALSFSGAGATVWEPMDLLEHAVRTHEGFMGVAFPQSDVVLFVADHSDKGGAHFGNGLISSDSADNPYVITHEAAHIWDVTPIWLARPRTWIGEGAAQFLSYLSEQARVGSPLPGPRSSCSLANSISELVGLGQDPALVYGSACNYVLGEGMFLSSTAAWEMRLSGRDSATCIWQAWTRRHGTPRTSAQGTTRVCAISNRRSCPVWLRSKRLQPSRSSIAGTSAVRQAGNPPGTPLRQPELVPASGRHRP